MKYCIVDIRKCFIGSEFLQDHYDCRIYDSFSEVHEYVKKFNAKPLHNLQENQYLDIRGNIINERGEAYVYVDANDEPHYFAVVEMPDQESGGRKNHFADKQEKTPTKR